MAESHQVANSEPSVRRSPEIELELKLLRDQVDLLQISTLERKKPWYNQISSIIGVIAILLSVFTFVYSQISQNFEEIRSKKKELRETLATLIDLRADFQTRILSITDQELRQAEGISLNNKRLINIEAADSLVTQIPAYVSWAEYGVLAAEHAADSDFTQAERYYKKAIDAGHTAIGKIFSIRALAVLYFSPTPLRDLDQGRKYFGDAVEVVKNPTDSYMAYTLGYTYEQWGINELLNGFQTEGNQKIELARKYYLDMPEPFRSQALGLLDKHAKQLVQPIPMLQPTPLKAGG
jgi:TPR repeat protein